jgi:signal transduction histidine kinase
MSNSNGGEGPPDQSGDAVRLLARGLAHDFNNLIAAILGHATYLRTIAGPGDVADTATTIETAAYRARDLAAQLQRLGGPPPRVDQPVKLNEIAHEVVVLIQPTLPPGVALRLDAETNTVAVRGNASQIHQLILNLVINARDALAGTQAGQIVVRTSKSPEGVALEVQDNGPGIPLAMRERIFEPFQTSKPAGEGSGLGLTIVRRIALTHGAMVSIGSADPHGAVFRVVFRAAS